MRVLITLLILSFSSVLMADQLDAEPGRCKLAQSQNAGLDPDECTRVCIYEGQTNAGCAFGKASWNDIKIRKIHTIVSMIILKEDSEKVKSLVKENDNIDGLYSALNTQFAAKACQRGEDTLPHEIYVRDIESVLNCASAKTNSSTKKQGSSTAR